MDKSPHGSTAKSTNLNEPDTRKEYVPLEHNIDDPPRMLHMSETGSGEDLDFGRHFVGGASGSGDANEGGDGHYVNPQQPTRQTRVGERTATSASGNNNGEQSTIAMLVRQNQMLMHQMQTCMPIIGGHDNHGLALNPRGMHAHTHTHALSSVDSDTELETGELRDSDTEETEAPEPDFISQLDNLGTRTTDVDTQASDGDALDELAMMFGDNAKTGEKVNEKLAKIVNGAAGSRLTEEKRKQILTKHPRPENVKVQSPRVNKGIWKSLRKSTKDADVMLQTIQTKTSEAMYPLLKMMEVLGNAKSSKSVLLPEEVGTMLSLANDTYIALQMTITDISYKRRLQMKYEINEDYRELCHADNPVTEQLFGDDLDTQVKTLENESKVVKKVTKTSFNNRKPVKTGPSNYTTGRDQPNRFYPKPHQRNAPYDRRYPQQKSHGFQQNSNYEQGGRPNFNNKNKGPFLGRGKPQGPKR
jgi:hypothetical protein